MKTCLYLPLYTILFSLGLTSCAHRKAPKTASDQPPSLIGKQLVLERGDAPSVYPFPRKHGLRITIPEDDGSSTVLYHYYNGESSEFYEETRVRPATGSPSGDYGYTRWKLNFSSPDSGTATLIAKAGKALRNRELGYTVPFLVEPIDQGR